MTYETESGHVPFLSFPLFWAEYIQTGQFAGEHPGENTKKGSTSRGV